MTWSAPDDNRRQQMDQHVNKVKEFSAPKIVGWLLKTLLILKDHLGLRKVKSRLVPKALNFLEKSRRVDVCETMLSDYQDKLKCIITEMRLEFMLTTLKQPTNQANIVLKARPDRKEHSQSRSKIKVMIGSFFRFSWCGALWIFSTWPKLLIRNIIWALWAIYVKQFV